MYKQTIEYEDFDGNQRKEDFYFNLTEAELTKLQISENGGLDKFLEKIVGEQDAQRVYEMFEKIVLAAYGEKSADGRRFVKNDEVRKNFTETQAYSDFCMNLVMDADKAAKFVNAIMPKKIQDKVAEKKLLETAGK